jgi:hypothetical protein
MMFFRRQRASANDGLPWPQEQRVETHASRDGEDKRPRSPRQGTAANRGVFRAASWITMAFWPGAAAGCCCSRPGTRLGAPCCPASSAEMRAVTDLGGRGPLAAVLRVHTACRGEDDSGWRPSLRRSSSRCCAVQTCSVQRAVCRPMNGWTWWSWDAQSGTRLGLSSAVG